MSQTTETPAVPPAVCKQCGKEILASISHHSLATPEPGKTGFGVLCHAEPVSGEYIVTSYALKLVVEQLAALKATKNELKVFKTETKLKAGRTENQLKINVAAEAEAEAEKTRVSLVTTHQALVKDLRKQLADAEEKFADEAQKRRGSERMLGDQIEGLKQELREAEKTSEILLTEKTEVLEKLAESERTAIDLRMQVEEANERTEQMRKHHRTFSENTLKICGALSTLGKRIVVLEKKLGIADTDDIRRIYREYLGEEPPDLSLEDDAPARDAAPKAAATAPAKNDVPAFIVEVHTPVPQVRPPVPPVRTTVLQDAAEPDSDASADDAGSDDAVGDHQVIEATDADDDVSSEEEQPETCTVCSGQPVGIYRFLHRDDGSKGELLTCKPKTQAELKEHGDVFLAYLRAKAKGNWSALDATDIDFVPYKATR